VDQSGRAIFYNDQLRDAAVKHLDMKARWQTRKMTEICGQAIMFFDEQGNYNVEAFLGKLNKVVKKGEKFALICNSGNRTQIVGNFLGKQQGYNVIDLQGGIQYAIGKKMPIEPYKPNP
jgi:rhodanese-related sulfurtransferase